MMEKELKAPKLRFPGFTDDWEQRKVAQYASFLAGNGLNWNDIANDGKKECILYGNLYTDYGMIADKVIYKTNAEINKPVYSEFGDVLIPASDTTPTGLARATSIEKSGVLLGGDINIIRPNKGINGSCLSLAFNANKNELIRLIKGTTVRHIHNSDIRDIIISLPKDENEQVKISMYFKQLDNLITLHQRKLDTLKKLKKGFLQKMFPKNGESVPEIRFPGFTDAWEQRKVSEITTSYSGGTPKSGTAEYYDGNIPFIRSGEIYSNKTELFITELGLNNSSAKMVHVGDILYALYGATSGEVSRAKLDGAINQAILAVLPNEEINADFLVEWFRKEKENIIATYLQGGQGNLSVQIIKDLMVDIPSSGEQKKIGDYFTNLNNLITLHQRKLDTLKKLKQGMLQQMFI